MLKRTQFHTNTGVQIKPFENEPFKMNFNDQNLQLAVSWSGDGYTDLLDTGYGSIRLSMADYILNSTTGYYDYTQKFDYEAHK
mmetsp:Transcript_262/g.258  ORF Transcript_262/g.258 Transcript_262/m.258 type:complete len:83 (+) Transcript_262:174-422(+)